jgi:Domain of unknown function (DUF6457)
LTADEWIAAFASEVGAREPDEETTAELLELAATAAHSSERIAAPIACYIAGVTGAPVSELRAIADGIGSGSA